MSQTWPPAEPTEVQLAAGDVQLAVDLRGGGMRRLLVGGWEVLDGYPPGATADGWRGSAPILGLMLPSEARRSCQVSARGWLVAQTSRSRSTVTSV